MGILQNELAFLPKFSHPIIFNKLIIKAKIGFTNNKKFQVPIIFLIGTNHKASNPVLLKEWFWVTVN
jgi:hypothetical protein